VDEAWITAVRQYDRRRSSRPATVATMSGFRYLLALENGRRRTAERLSFHFGAAGGFLV